MMIKFASQTSAGRGSKLMRPLRVLLSKIFANEDIGIDSKDLDYFSIIFRVAGNRINFDNGDGCERIKKVRGEKAITMDYVVPQHKWEEMSDEAFKIYIANAVKECFEELKKKAKKLKWEFNEEKLDRDFTKGIDSFLIRDL